MKALLKKQVDYLKVISDNTTKDTLLQEAQIALEIKTDKDTREDDKKNREELIDIKEALNKGLIQTSGDGVNSNVIKLSELVAGLTTEVNSANDDTFAREKSLEAERRDEQALKKQEENNTLLQKLIGALKEGFKKPGDTKLDGLGTGLVIALGALAGAISGYVKAIVDMNKFIASGIAKMFSGLFKLLPESIRSSLSTALDYIVKTAKGVIDGAMTRLTTTFDVLTESASKQLTRVVKFISDVPFKVMTFVDDLLLKLPPKIGGPILQFIDDAAKWIKSAGKWVLDIPKKIIDFFSGFAPLFETLEKGSGPISRLVTFIKTTFGNIVSGLETVGSKLSVFSNMFGAVAKIAQKIAYPLTVVMAVWDTVKGAIEGYDKDGIVGAIKGAITGLFNSLIGGLLDMIKSGISWIAGKLGFSEVEKTLDSFSFQDLFKEAVDAVFGFVKSIGKWISNKIEAVKNFFGFGIDDKKKAAKDRLLDAKKSLKTAETAASIGAIGVDDQGNTSTAISLVNGVPDREGAAQEVQSQGYRLMTEDEKKSYLDQKNKDVMDAEKALTDIENIPTLSKIWEDFKFGDAIKSMIASAFGTIPDMLKDAGSWIASKLGFTKVQEYLDSFSFTKTFSDIIDAITNPMDTLERLFGDISDGINNHVLQPIENMFNDVQKLFEDNVTKPLKKHFEPISKFFSDVEKQMMSMLEDFGIPKVSFTIPIINKEVSIGPFYPFRPEAGTQRISTNTKLTETSTGVSGDGESGKSGSKHKSTSTVLTGAGLERDSQGQLQLSKDKTQVLTKSSSESSDKESGVSSRQFSKALAEFDPKTGKATLSRTSAEGRESKSISMRAFRKIKQNAEAGGTTAEVDAIVKEDEAYQKLSFLDKRKVDVGLASATELLKVSVEKQESQSDVSMTDPEASLVQSAQLEKVNGKKISAEPEKVNGKKISAEPEKVNGKKISAEPEKVNNKVIGADSGVPPIPQMPSAEGMKPGEKRDLGDGSMLTLNKDGTVTKSDGSGTYTYDKSGKAIRYDSPSFAGAKKSVDLTTNQSTSEYSLGPMSVVEKPNGSVAASYDFGLAKASAQYSSIAATSPIDSRIVYEKSKMNEEAKAAATTQTAPVIVSAPTTNVSNNRQNITIPQPVRNDDRDLFNYNMSRSAFIS